MTTVSARFLCNCLGALALSCLPVSVGLSETLDLDALRVAVEAGDVAAQRDLGKALVLGAEGVAIDTAEGLRLLDLAATGGDAAAQSSLGKILLDGYYTAADHDAAVRWLKAAGENGDVVALRVLGSYLVGGWVLDQDVETGLPLLEKAVAAGDVEATVTLGQFFLYGEEIDQDLPRALALFEQAADAGEGRGLAAYGSMLMWNKQDTAAAERHLRRAGEMGVGSAWTTLAQGAMWGYLGSNNRRKFDAFAARAVAAGETRIPVFEAQRRMWGISMRANGPEAIGILEAAAETGNVDALKFLISLVRDGNSMNIHKDRNRAREYLDEFADLLTATERGQYLLSFDVAKANSTQAFAALHEELERHPEFRSDWFGEDLYAANPNFAVYVLQSDMREHGTYAGSLNGLATRSTLKALWNECKAAMGKKKCGDDVMESRVIGALLAR